jgi:hypothetical protein
MGRLSKRPLRASREHLLRRREILQARLPLLQGRRVLPQEFHVHEEGLSALQVGAGLRQQEDLLQPRLRLHQEQVPLREIREILRWAPLLQAQGCSMLNI